MARLAIAVCCYAAIFSVVFLLSIMLRFDIEPMFMVRAVSGELIVAPQDLAGRELFEFEQKLYALAVFRNAIIPVVLLKIAVVLFSRDWRRHLRYSSIQDLAWSAGLCVFCGVLLAATQLARETMPQISRGVLFIDTVLSTLALLSTRVMANLLRTQWYRMHNPGARRVLIYASGGDAAALLSSLQSGDSALKVVGIISPVEVRRNGGLMRGVRVYGVETGLPEILRRTSAEMVLIPSRLPGRSVRPVIESCQELGVETHLIPLPDEIPSGRFELRMRDITIDDLLRREPNQLNLDAIRKLCAGRVVLVTGAAGSIGSEVCRQVLQFNPCKLLLLDQSEFGIFQLEQEFRDLRQSGGIGNAVSEFIVEDITDETSMGRLFMQHRPEVVFHAAAYKHVPLMESNPHGAVRNNVIGTRVITDLADRYRVDRFVMISTDKAVRPTNVMGATKLVAEEYLASVARRSQTQFITVRFGNVLNSAGSVVPTFRRQIEQGGPVTVTDPMMQRYFMTIPEAVQLVLQSATIGNGGDILILDMGEPVRIVELAKDMIRLSGQRYPDDIDIVFTGLRPGEKMYEELFYETEHQAARIHEKIFRAPRAVRGESGLIVSEINQLEQTLGSGRDEVRSLLWRIADRIVAESSAAGVEIEHSLRAAA